MVVRKMAIRKLLREDRRRSPDPLGHLQMLHKRPLWMTLLSLRSITLYWWRFIIATFDNQISYIKKIELFSDKNNKTKGYFGSDQLEIGSQSGDDFQTSSNFCVEVHQISRT